MAAVTLSNVVKRFGNFEIVHGANIDVSDGEFVVFVGPSGCGKSTLLRMIAGLEDISGGEIAIGGKVVNDVEPADRGIAMVFQSYALYPHMTVEQNLSFGLRMTGNPKADTERRVKRASEILRITELMARRPPGKEAVELEQVGGLGGARLDLGLGQLRHLHAEADILLHRQVGEKRIGLEHHADLAPVGGKACNILPVDTD